MGIIQSSKNKMTTHDACYDTGGARVALVSIGLEVYNAPGDIIEKAV